MLTRPHAATISEPQPTTDVEAMSEPEFLESILDQLLTDQRHPVVRFTDAEREVIEEEHIGDHFLQYPFLY